MLIKRIGIIILYSLWLQSVWAIDRILEFDSTITINQDSSILVQETITLFIESQKRGMIRTLPIGYKTPFGSRSMRAYSIIKVLQDNKETPYRVSKRENDLALYIGDPHTMVSPGNHIYTIWYKTSRQIGFFKDHDELYWNVTGNQWPFAIDRVNAKVVFALPDIVQKDIKNIHLEGYTGYAGARGKNFVSSLDLQGVAHFTTKSTLEPAQGLTIVVTWPKGYIPEPSILTKLLYLIKDNIEILLSFFGFIIVLLYYCMTWIRERRSQRPGTIIPLFEPPAGMLPGAMRFMMYMRYDTKAFAAEIVNMAVHGLLTIEYKKKTWSELYALIKRASIPSTTSPLYKTILNTLFSKSNKIELTRANANILDTAQTRYLINAQLGYQYLKDNSKYITLGSVLSFFALLPLIISALISQSNVVLLFVFISIFATLLGLFSFLLKGYTPEGRKLIDQIQGFKLFLKTTEVERLKVIGTPPTKNPELFEKYLPYAMALNVENQWASQFAPIFDRLKQEGLEYKPVWFSGSPNFILFSANQFSSSLNYNLQTAGYTQVQAPGTYSGSGGRGSSGGGGGGGGGGTW